MENKNNILKKLKEIGFKDEEIDGVISDVMQIIFARYLGDYFLKLSESEQKRFKDFSADEMVEYFGNNKEILPEFSAQEFDKVYNDTWEGYFETLSK